MTIINDEITKIISLSKEIAERADAALSANESIDTHRTIGNLDYIFRESKAALLKKAEKIYKFRRQREKTFASGDLFGDPGWDILLDLYISHLKGIFISVTSACSAAQVPLTTGLRWLTEMEKENLIERAFDEKDHRRRWVRLTPVAIKKMTELLEMY